MTARDRQPLAPAFRDLRELGGVPSRLSKVSKLPGSTAEGFSRRAEGGIREHDLRKEITRERKIERARQRTAFDMAVLRWWYDDLGIRESAKLLGRTRKVVEASRAWLGITGSVPSEREFVNRRAKRRIEVALSVATLWALRLGADETSRRVATPVLIVKATRAWLGLETGRDTYRAGVVSGRLGSRAAINRLLSGAVAWGDSDTGDSPHHLAQVFPQLVRSRAASGFP